jgi:hypothetical protein
MIAKKGIRALLALLLRLLRLAKAGGKIAQARLDARTTGARMNISGTTNDGTNFLRHHRICG